MKTLSNTSISIIFAVGLTLLVALMQQIPFFKDKDTQTMDEMMLLRYELHQKYSPLKPDPHLVLAAIDQQTLDDFGRWPFPRLVHGEFLRLLEPESPRTVGWDIFFTEQESVDASSAPAGSTPTAAAPETSNPSSTPAATAPPSDASMTAPANPTSVPSAAPVPAQPPDTQVPAPAPIAPPTNAAPATPSASSSNFDLIPIGADMPSGNAPSSPTPETATAPGSPAAASPSAAGTAPAVPAANTETPSVKPLTESDQYFVDHASRYPSMVTAAEVSGTPQDPKHPLTAQSLLPTRPFTHVNGDTSQVLSAPNATLPFPALRKVSYFGFANENPESGGGSRRTDPMIVNVAGMILPSFDLQVLMQYWGVDPDKVTINMGRDITLPRPDGSLARIPIDDKGLLIINYRARISDFQADPYSLLGHGLDDKSSGKISEAVKHLPPLKDNIVIVGATFNGIDAGPTPLDGVTPLVDTHLNALNNILQQDFVSHVSAWIWMPFYAVFLLVTGNLMLRVGIAPMIPMGLLALALMAGVGFALLFFANYLVPVATPELGILLLAGAVPTKRFFGEEREKMRVRKAMGTYLSPKVMDKILSHPDGVKLGGVKQVITIMFCDIRGFTAYCDNRDPQEVLNVVNEYFEEMTKVVFKYEGTVDKYIGDCIMAFWNAPEDQPDHAQRAVCCAMEMRYALANFKVKRAGLDTELFECGIGIHTGEALVGNMGSTLKVNYTAMGSTVNLGARLESLTKKLNERILISHATFEQLTGDFPLTDRGEAMVPGFANPIHVYGVGAEQDLQSAISVGLKLAKKQDYTAEEVTKPIWAPAPLPEDADPNP